MWRLARHGREGQPQQKVEGDAVDDEDTTHPEKWNTGGGKAEIKPVTAYGEASEMGQNLSPFEPAHRQRRSAAVQPRKTAGSSSSGAPPRQRHGEEASADMQQNGGEVEGHIRSEGSDAGMPRKGYIPAYLRVEVR